MKQTIEIIEDEEVVTLPVPETVQGTPPPPPEQRTAPAPSPLGQGTEGTEAPDVPPPPVDESKPQPAFNYQQPAPPPPTPVDIDKLVEERVKPLQEKLDQTNKAAELEEKQKAAARKIQNLQRKLKTRNENGEDLDFDLLDDYSKAREDGKKILAEIEEFKNSQTTPTPTTEPDSEIDPNNPWLQPGSKELFEDWMGKNPWMQDPSFQSVSDEVDAYSKKLLAAGWKTNDIRTYNEVNRHIAEKFPNMNSQQTQNPDVGTTNFVPGGNPRPQGTNAVPTTGTPPHQVRIDPDTVRVMDIADK